MNEVLSGIRKNQEEFPEQRHYVTIVTFEGSGIDGVKTRRDRVPIGTVEPFTEKDYRPGGCWKKRKINAAVKEPGLTKFYSKTPKNLGDIEILTIFAEK